MCLFVCLLVCWSAFYRPQDICPLCGAASKYSETSQGVAGGHFAALPPSIPRAAKPSRAAGQAHAHSESTRTHAVQLLNEKIAALMPLKNNALACCRIRNCGDFQKKGKKKTNMPLPKFSLQFAFSWSVYFSNRTESYLIFGRSRLWSARFTICTFSCACGYAMWSPECDSQLNPFSSKGILFVSWASVNFCYVHLFKVAGA